MGYIIKKNKTKTTQIFSQIHFKSACLYTPAIVKLLLFSVKLANKKLSDVVKALTVKTIFIAHLTKKGKKKTIIVINKT